MLKRIDRIREQGSRAERRVAAWVLNHPRETLDSTLAEMARKIGTSEPTVVRFCRRLGASGFSDMKLRLAEALSRPASYLHRDVTPGDSAADAVMKVMDRSVHSIMKVRDIAAQLPFEQAIAAMRQARQWVFCGLGASGWVARDACQKYFRLGVPCSAQSDTPTILQTCAVLGQGDVMLMISHSGRWSGVADSARLARDNGACIIALTKPGSPMAREADLLFDCEVSEDTSVYTPMSSRLAHLAVLDALQVSLALALGERAEKNLARCKKALGAA